MSGPTSPSLVLMALLFTGASALAQDAHLAVSGNDLFLTHCASCHGDEADAGASGNIRGLSPGTIRGAMNGIEQMPSFSFLTDPEIDAIVDWLAASGG